MASDYESMNSKTLVAIDKTLAGYYKYRGRDGYYNDEGIGKFIEWVEENAYNSDTVAGELDSDVDKEEDDYEMVAFDEDFPSELNGIQKYDFIYSLMKSAGGNNNIANTTWEQCIFGYHVRKYQAKLIYINFNEFAVACAENVLDDKYHSTQERHYNQNMWIYNCLDKKWRFECKYPSWTRLVVILSSSSLKPS